MTEILAVAAFFISFGTVFLVNDAMRKTERKQDAALKSTVDSLKSEIGDLKKAIRELHEEYDAVKDQLKGGDEKSQDMKRRMDGLEDKLIQVNGEIENLNMALGPKTRKGSRKSA